MQSSKTVADRNAYVPNDIAVNPRQQARKIALAVGLVPVLFFGLLGVFGCFLMGSWTPVVFFGGFGSVVGAGLGLVTYRGALKKSSNLGRPWQDVLVGPYREFAEQVEGTLVVKKPMLGGWVPGMPEYVDFAVDGNKAVLRQETEPSGNGRPCLRLTIDLPDPTALRCHVYEQDIVSKFKGTDIELGWDRFDQQFAVTAGNRSDLVPQCLTRHVQEALLALQEWLQEREHRENVELFIERNQIAVRVSVLFDNVDDLMAFFSLGKNIYMELRENLK